MTQVQANHQAAGPAPSSAVPSSTTPTTKAFKRKVALRAAQVAVVTSLTAAAAAIFSWPMALMVGLLLVYVVEAAGGALMARRQGRPSLSQGHHTKGGWIGGVMWFSRTLLGSLLLMALVAVLLALTLAFSSSTVDIKLYAERSVGDWYVKESQRVDRHVGQQMAALELAASSIDSWQRHAAAKAEQERTEGGSCATRSTTKGDLGVITTFRTEDADVAQTLLDDVRQQLGRMQKLAAQTQTTKAGGPVTPDYGAVVANVAAYNQLIDSAAKVAKGSGFMDSITKTLDQRANTRISGPASAPDSGPYCGDNARLALIARAKQAMAPLSQTEPLDRLTVPIQMDNPTRVVSDSLTRMYNLLFMGLTGGAMGSLADDPLTQQQVARAGWIGQRTMPLVIAVVLEILLLAGVWMHHRQLAQGVQPVHASTGLGQHLAMLWGRQKAATSGTPTPADPLGLCLYRALENALWVKIPIQTPASAPAAAFGSVGASHSPNAANSTQGPSTLGPVTLGETQPSIACPSGPRGLFSKEVMDAAGEMKDWVHPWRGQTLIILPHVPGSRKEHVRCAQLAKAGFLSPVHAACRFQQLHPHWQFMLRAHHTLPQQMPLNDVRWAVWKVGHALYAQELRLLAMA